MTKVKPLLHSHASHSFSTQLAKRFNSIQAAVLLQHFYFWCKNNRENNKNFHDENWWTYNTVKALNEYFDYLPPNKIRGAVELLKKEGLLITGNYNSTPYDRTVWYALTEAGWNIFGESICENHKCICGNKKCNCENNESNSENKNSKSEDNKSKSENNEYKDIKTDTLPDLKQLPNQGQDFLKVYEGWGFEEKRIYDSLNKVTLKEVELIAPEKNITWLIEKYAPWVKKKGWPKNINSAFPAWVKSFLKKKENQTPPSELASTFKPKKFNSEKVSLEVMINRMKHLLQFFPNHWEKFFAGKLLEETEKGWKIIVDDSEALQHEALLEQINVKIKMI